MDVVQIFNAVEAVFWMALAALAATVGHRVSGFTPQRQVALAIFLAAFGCSDIIEIFTGGWWKPPALLAFKAICLIGLAITAFLIYRTRWRRTGS